MGKVQGNPVTLADLESDRHIRAGLAAAFPDDAILSEETADDASRLQQDRVWIVDPMDGTKEFTEGIPEFAVSIALVDRGEPVVGVVDNPAASTAVWASRGGGTFRDGNRVTVSSVADLSECSVIASRSEIRRGEFEPFEGGSVTSAPSDRSLGSWPVSRPAMAISIFRSHRRTSGTSVRGMSSSGRREGPTSISSCSRAATTRPKP